MMLSRKRLVLPGVMALAVTGFITGPAAAASGATTVAGRPTVAQTCWKKWKTVSVSGGKMKYTKCHRTYHGKKQSSAAFYLWDMGYPTDPYARVVIGKWERTWTWSEADGGPRSPKYQSGWHNGKDAKVYLTVR